MEPVLTAHLFLPLQTELVSLLRGLSMDDWSKPTVAGSWQVKDVVAHLLDGDLRRLSSHRDRYTHPSRSFAPRDYDDLVRFINSFNASWVEEAKRFSPQILVDLLEWAGPQVGEFFSSLPAEGEAWISVAWAGEDRSTNWMDIGREYTEKWHHQAQIRDAVGAPGLMSRRWLYPVFELSMYALPHSFRLVNAPAGSVLNITIDGEAGGEWSIVRSEDRWLLKAEKKDNASASVRMDADTAWRVFFNALGREEAERKIAASGDPSIYSMFFNTRAVMV